MNRAVRILFRVVTVVLVLSAVAWIGLAIRQRAVYGKVLTDEDRSATVELGDRFSLSVDDFAFAGIRWTSSVEPDSAVRFVEERVANSVIVRLLDIGSDEIGGSRGSLTYIYEAAERGTVTITMSRCNKYCNEPEPTDTYTTATWTITVK